MACCSVCGGGGKVLETKADADLKPKAHATMIEALIVKWKREANGYVSGSMLPSPAGEMNRAAADAIRKILAELEAAEPNLRRDLARALDGLYGLHVRPGHIDVLLDAIADSVRRFIG